MINEMDLTSIIEKMNSIKNVISFFVPFGAILVFLVKSLLSDSVDRVFMTKVKNFAISFSYAVILFIMLWFLYFSITDLFVIRIEMSDNKVFNMFNSVIIFLFSVLFLGAIFFFVFSASPKCKNG